VPEHFLGRDDSLAAIETSLARYEGRVAITAVHGLRGVGKTTLAAAYAEKHRGDYRATWWIGAQTDSTMRADLVALGVRLGWVGAEDKEEPALGLVMERLRHEGEGILLIYDNAIDADALKPYLPRGGAAKVLVTSNAPAWRGVAEPVEIRLWPKEIGADYFIARTGREAERAAAEVLSDALGGLPLAHEQAAAYCERLDISLGEYRKRFDAAPARLLDDVRHAPAEYHDGLTVAKTFALAIEEAAKLHPAAEPLIVHAALLAPEPIPLFLFAEAREKFGEPLASALEGDGLDEAVAALRTFALLDRETITDERDASITTDTIRLHRLVRQVAAARREGEAREEARRALIEAVAAVYPGESVYNDPQSWPRARRLDALALELVGVEAEPPKGTEEQASGLLNALAAYRHGPLAAYALARPLYERALAICEKVLGLEHPGTAASLNNLAVLLHDKGDLAGARPLHERALAIYEKAYGPMHPLTAESLNNLALLLKTQGELEGARPLYERALAINETALGPEHPDTATSLGNLANLLTDQGELEGARSLYERALAINETALGPEHPDTAISLTNLGLLLQSQGEFAGARPLHGRALVIFETALGPEHPLTARSLNNLALVLHAQGDLAGARSFYERALAICEKALGSEHPDTARSLNNLASLLKVQGDLVGARPLHERALAIYEKALGPEHPDTNITRSHFALLLLASNKPDAALISGETALAAHEKLLGQDHPWTKGSARVTADALDALGRADEAAALRACYGLEPKAPPSE
jgi:tetratricopeptide (TPR) repeat protein